MTAILMDIKRTLNLGLSEPKVSSMVLFMCKVCMTLTFVACVLITAKNSFGETIRCITPSGKSGATSDQTAKAIETYCLFSSTFTITQDDRSRQEAHPGVGPLGKGGEKRHAYYQWVPLVLLLQSLIYYIPNYMWQSGQGVFFKSVMGNLSIFQLGDTSKHIKASARYFASSLNLHLPYGVSFLLCEFLALILSGANLIFTNWFLGGEFFSFGFSAFINFMENGTVPNRMLSEVFPKVTKCTWRQFGHSGTVETLDSLCVLPLNIVNEKTYIFLWIAYTCAAVICAIVLLFHFALVFLPSIRNKLLICQAKGREKQALQTILPSCSFGDWFLLYHFKSSMVYFREWVIQVEKNLQERSVGDQRECGKGGLNDMELVNERLTGEKVKFETLGGTWKGWTE